MVVGGGAAGIFAAIAAREHHPQKRVVVLEKTARLLDKVRISGGGRCNVTHHCFSPAELVKHYPRGGKSLKQIFARFGPADTVRWFEQRGVALKVEPDGRMFPQSNSSQSIVDCLLDTAKQLGVEIFTQVPVTQLCRTESGWRVESTAGSWQATNVILATGGSPKLAGMQWLMDLGLDVEPPVPSLFTFNLMDKSSAALMGIALPAKVRIAGFPLVTEGPVLFTHWGFSGPAVLRLSAFAARWLQEREYRYQVLVNWANKNEEALRQELQESWIGSAKKVSNAMPVAMPQRLWEYLLDRAEVLPEKRWMDLSKKELNKLLATLCQDSYAAQGKTTFKEEFVTAGGVKLGALDLKTMGAKNLPGLYLCGEVVDVDGVTGGFNFQWAWASGYLAGKLGA